VGALGGNVLKNFRMEIDYPHEKAYLEQKATDCDNDMNSAGLVLDVDAANNLVVRAISSTAAALTKTNIHPGDQIIEIDGKRERLWKVTEASDALSGPVGETKRLVIKRGGQEIQTTAVVAHLL
jgi:C-terminal processing protease CtpA/Prc